MRPICRCLITVLSTIYLDDEPPLQADKVDDAASNQNLALEFMAAQPAISNG